MADGDKLVPVSAIDRLAPADKRYVPIFHTTRPDAFASLPGDERRAGKTRETT